MAGVLQALKIPVLPTRTSNFTPFAVPQSVQAQSTPFQITSYRASNRVTVTIRDITKVADTIDVLVGSGTNGSAASLHGVEGIETTG